MSFDLEFSLFWVSRLFDLGDLGDLEKSPVNVFKNYIFEISEFYILIKMHSLDFDLKIRSGQGCTSLEMPQFSLPLRLEQESCKMFKVSLLFFIISLAASVTTGIFYYKFWES